MLRFTHGFDVEDEPGIGLRYTSLSGSAQTARIVGRDNTGFAYWMFNDLGGHFDHVLSLTGGLEPYWWAADIAWYNSGTETSIVFGSEFWQAGNAMAGIICSMKIRLDGHVTFRLGTDTGGPPPIDLAVSSNVFPVTSSALGFQPAWGKLEVQVGAGFFIVNYEGTQIMHGSASQLTGIDTFVWRIRQQNWAIDNHYILDSNPGLTGFQVGGCRIDTFVPNALFGGDQWTPNGNPSGVVCIAEHGPTGNFPDGDTTYVTPTVIRALQQYGFPRPDCYGLILGIGINACCKPIGVTPAIGAYVRPTVALFQIGNNKAVIDSGSTIEPGYIPMHGYRTYQFITEKNPSNLQSWNDGAVAAAEWGLRAETSTGVNFTQFSLEKLVSLNPGIQFTCGGVGSYVW